MSFSKNNGYVEVREGLQIKSIDNNLKIKIWNLIYTVFFKELDHKYHFGNRTGCEEICEFIWTDFFERTIDEIPPYVRGFGMTFKEEFKETYNRMQWWRIYDLIEFLCVLDEKYFFMKFSNKCNSVLEMEKSGYRIMDNKVLQITSEVEISSIEQALSESIAVSPVSQHMKRALELLTNRTNPDYRNSIKESISAVEAICAEITNNNKATLGEALIEIEKKYKLHPALKKSFSLLYGYTSDSGGIRHKLIEDDTIVSHEDAVFMLVSCTAFINYLRSKL